MKTVKVIIGLVVGFFATTTMFQMFFEESGAGLFGAVTGYVIIMTICIWLVYSGLKSKNVMVQETVIKQESGNTHKQIENLKDLRDQNILTKEEFDFKVKTINNAKEERALKQTDEYKKLLELLDNGILSQAEFKDKVEILKSKIAKETILSKPIKNIQESDIIGHWENENNLLSFEGDSFKYSYKNSTGKGIIGKWNFDKTSNRIVLLRDSKEDYFQILKLSKKEIIYQHKKSKFRFIKQ